MPLIALGGKVEGEEDGPDDEKWPDIGVEGERQGIMESGSFYLGIVDKRRSHSGDL
jgi:hypothetical protein